MQLSKTLLHTTDNYIKSLEKSGIIYALDLIMHFPRDYEDRTNVLDSFSLINLKEKNTILLTLVSIDSNRSANNKLITKAIFEDKNGFMAEGVWFNRKYFANTMKAFAGKKVLVSGKVKYDFGKVVFPSPDVETDLSKVSGEIVPVYPDANYIPGKWIASKMEFIKPFLNEVEENLPEEILKKYNFLPRKEALYKLHFPKNIHDIEEAKYRLAYEELYLINYFSLSKKYESFKETEGKSMPIALDVDFVKVILEKLPFPLTDHQKIVLFQILKDMEKPHSMQRLLEGDVGTGKTVVAMISAIHSILVSRKKGIYIQAAFMAPTEILARQHFEGMQNFFFEFGLSSELLVGSTTAKNKVEIKEKLKSGNLDIVIGTHALVQEDVHFNALGFVVIDEQHRFGVRQREVLEKYNSPHPSPHPRGEGTIMYDQKEYNPRYIVELSKELRKNQTEAEEILWEFLRNRKFNNLKFRRQHPIGRYIADFYSEELKLIIELDGKIHDNQKEYDEIRNEIINAQGIQVLRFKNEDVLTDISIIFNSIIPYIPLPLGEVRGGLKSSIMPHVLNMTATPIPRTLALTLYGDQDLSIISEYPKGRKDIFTKIASTEDARYQIENFVRSEIEKGRQVFWISPLVEESEKVDLANAISTYESLVEIFSPFKVGLLHGKMKPKEKEAIMKQFTENEIQILSSTSVIEVGVNVPNATIMCIEGAERFGLSQLHQFRGRVGRGQFQSYCYLFPSKGQRTDRLKAMERTNNGFELSEIDLEIRGPGEVYGVRQSGVPDLKIADLRDLELVSQIREDIETLVLKK